MRLYLLCFLLICTTLSYGQSHYSRVKIPLHQQAATDVAALGIDLSHGEFIPGKHYINDFSSEEIAKLEAAGIQYERLIDDVVAFYRDQNSNLDFRNEVGCAEAPAFADPANFHIGSMGGFFTIEELASELDEMRELYPDLISAKLPLSENSIEGRPIYWLRISDQPDIDEDEPEVLYTAIHHAREPSSLSQLIYFMWYVLENYESNPQIQYLVNETELYFIPMINPDGYVFNQVNSPEGGGLWRKNRRLNPDGSFGVDLNRNYDFMWGVDNIGSSPDPESQTYRGLSGFSEPETRAVRDFCQSHEFVAAYNYHTFGNYLIYPWGFVNEVTPDSTLLSSWGRLFTEDNCYQEGTGFDLLGYSVNGDSDDWMYGDQVSKPKIFSFTPEVGRIGFWPPANRVLPEARENLQANLYLASIPHKMGQVSLNTERYVSDSDVTINYNIQRYGLQDGPLTVRLVDPQGVLAAPVAEQTFDLALSESANAQFSFQFNSTITPGDNIPLEVIVDNGLYELSTPLDMNYLPDVPFYSNDFNSGLGGWTVSSGDWQLTDVDAYDPPNSLTDSPPGEDYAHNSEQIIVSDIIEWTAASDFIKLFFRAKWDIEAGYDYAQFQVKVNEEDWQTPCGHHTVEGNENQDTGQPLFDGVQSEWVHEEIDLSDLINQGDQVQFRFRLVSDQFVAGDGMYIDAFEVFAFDAPSHTNQAKPLHLSARWYPNPAQDELQLRLSAPLPKGSGTFSVYNQLGSLVWEHYGPLPDRLTTVNWPAGVYYSRWQTDSAQYILPKFVLIRP